ncbi:hypothetical protein P4S80_15625, partial [Aeribacillus composti]|uniref:hypothetical protein n=1 Tax=Aeribacillus composti TaxID=1868734 RepID=UPI002E1A7820|nr:hypothetical protein [Aeribacillus composti]
VSFLISLLVETKDLWKTGNFSIYSLHDRSYDTNPTTFNKKQYKKRTKKTCSFSSVRFIFVAYRGKLFQNIDDLHTDGE